MYIPTVIPPDYQMRQIFWIPDQVGNDKVALPLQQQVLLFALYWALRSWILTSLAFASTYPGKTVNKECPGACVAALVV